MNIWQFETAQFRVTVHTLPCDDLDLSWDEDGEVRAKLGTGEFEAFDVHATCIHLPSGVHGDSYLGGCIYADPREFRDNVGMRVKSRRDGCYYGSYFSDLVHECIADCRRSVAAVQNIRIRAA